MGGKTLNEEDYCTKNPGLSAMGPSATRQENHSIILWMTVEAIESQLVSAQPVPLLLQKFSLG